MIWFICGSYEGCFLFWRKTSLRMAGGKLDREQIFEFCEWLFTCKSGARMWKIRGKSNTTPFHTCEIHSLNSRVGLEVSTWRVAQNINLSSAHLQKPERHLIPSILNACFRNHRIHLLDFGSNPSDSFHDFKKNRKIKNRKKCYSTIIYERMVSST